MLQGGAYRLQNRFEPARAEYEKAIYYAPSCEAYSALGTTYLHLGQVDRAREAYRRALEFNPEFEPAQQGMQLVNNAAAKIK
jgi:tetratricopeptide (TPR) repeat protein